MLPDRDALLQAVNGRLAGSERFTSMGAAHCDNHGDVSDHECPHAMVHNGAHGRPLRLHTIQDRLELADGHRLIGLVVDTRHRTTPRVIPHDPLKTDHGAVLIV